MASITGQLLGQGGRGRPGRSARNLPQLRRSGLTAYTIIASLLLVIAIVATVGAASRDLQNRNNPVWLPLGLAIRGGEEIRVQNVITPEAEASGIRRGDQIVAIDGRPVPRRQASLAVRPWLDRADGEQVRLSVRRPNEPGTREIVLSRDSARGERVFRDNGITKRVHDWLMVLMTVLPAAALVPAAILLFRLRRDSVPALLSLALLLLTAFTFNAGVFWSWLDLHPVAARGAALGWAGLILVLLAFPSGRFQPRWTAWVALLVAIWLAISLVDPTLLEAARGLDLSLLALLGVVALVTRYRRVATFQERQQIRWALFGFAGGIACLVVYTALAIYRSTHDLGSAGYVWQPIASGFVASLGAALVAGGLLVSLLRFRLYDADTVISRSAGYAVMSLAAAAIFAASAKGVESYFEMTFGRDAGAWPGVIGAGLAAAAIVPAHRRIHDWAERRFQRALLHLRRDLPECAADLRETESLGALVDAVLDRIVSTVRATRAAAVVAGEIVAVRGVDQADVRGWMTGSSLQSTGDALDCDRGDALFPMRIPLTVRHAAPPEPIGWLLLGSRPDGSFYGKDEREALAEVSDPVARAVHIALQRERRERDQQRRFDALDAAIAEIRKSLAALKPRAKKSPSGVRKATAPRQAR